MTTPPPFRLSRFAVPALCLAAGLAVGAALAGLQHGRRAQDDVDGTRLDPSGLAAFPPESAQISRRPGALRLVVLGDSRAREWRTLPALPGGPPLELVNRGVVGQTAPQVAGRYAAHVAPLAPDVVIIQAGFNDVTSAARVAASPADRAVMAHRAAWYVRAIADAAAASGADVVVTTVFPPGRRPRLIVPGEPPELPAAVEQFNVALRMALDAAPRVRVVDAWAALAGEGKRARPAYVRDALHLSPAGYAAVNDVLAPVLDSLARARGQVAQAAAGP